MGFCNNKALDEGLTPRRDNLQTIRVNWQPSSPGKVGLG